MDYLLHLSILSLDRWKSSFSQWHAWHGCSWQHCKQQRHCVLRWFGGSTVHAGFLGDAIVAGNFSALQIHHHNGLAALQLPRAAIRPPSRSHKVTEVASSAAFFNPSDKQALEVQKERASLCLGYIRPSHWGNEKLQGTAGHWRSGPNAASGTETKSVSRG